MAGGADRSVTELLGDLRRGEDGAFAALFEEVYSDLRRRARGQRRRWKGDPSLNTTALAHEAYLDLVDEGSRSWEDRSHFFAVAARAMRHILIQEARRKRAQKRGGDAPVLSLDEMREELGREVAEAEEQAEILVMLDEAVSRLAEERGRAARVVECRFFAEMTVEQTAEALSVSVSTVSRDWRQARAWLYREMERIQAGGRASEGPTEDGEEAGGTKAREKS